MGYGYLIAAIVSEVVATSFLKVAASGGMIARLAWVVVVVGYVLSYAMLHLCLRTGFPLGIAYAIWAGVGVASIAVIAAMVFSEPMTKLQMFGVVLVVLGIAALQLCGPVEHDETPPPPSASNCPG